ncbi:MAG: CXXX repeat peptide modification system protein [Alistipes sp.]|nr:CXXX repeat peptide modification system protein [Alistipes sp.]
MKIIGKVTEDEKKEIEAIFERKNALYELAKILDADNEALYEKLVKDLAVTNAKYQTWWDDMADKYKWESIENGRWEINFRTCEIILIS